MHREYDFLTFDELTNRVIAGWESVYAMLVGILCAASDDRSGMGLDPLGLLDVEPVKRIGFVLALAGWTCFMTWMFLIHP